MRLNRCWSDELAGILLGKVLDGRLARFVRAEGEFFIVSVDGQEQAISREVWRELPDQQVEEEDRVLDLDHQRKHRG